MDGTVATGNPPTPAVTTVTTTTTTTPAITTAHAESTKAAPVASETTSLAPTASDSNVPAAAAPAEVVTLAGTTPGLEGLELEIAKAAEIEREAAKLREMQARLEQSLAVGTAVANAASMSTGALSSSTNALNKSGTLSKNSSGSVPRVAGSPATAFPTHSEREDADQRSIFVLQVDYSATAQEVQRFFQSCGTVLRVTIVCDKYTGRPKGCAYVEFADTDAVQNALVLDESMFKGRPLQIRPKRTNVHGFGRGGYRGRGRGRGRYRGRGRGRGRYSRHY